MDFKCIFFFIVGLIVGRTDADFHGYTWTKVQLNSQNRPCPRLDASTWVDDRDWLWLYGGKNLSNTSQQLYDLWKYDTNSSKWFHIPNDHPNSTMPPTDGLPCFCRGLFFLLVGHSNRETMGRKLWIYNSSKNSWQSKDLPESVNKNDSHPVGIWCDGDALMFLDHTTNGVLHMWRYNILTSSWTSRPLNGTGNDTQMVLGTSNNYISWSDCSAIKIYLWHAGITNGSMLLQINHSTIEIFHIVGKHPNLTMMTGFVHWGDRSGNLWVLNYGKMRNNSSQVCLKQCVFDIATHKWVPVGIKKPYPHPKADAALTWRVSDEIWLFSGYREQLNGSVVVRDEFWTGLPFAGKHVLPIKPLSHLPGDSLGLSMTDKLIISGLVLLAVMTVSVRLCYKRELNQMLSKLRRRRVPYHQLSQEGDKGSRL